MGKAALAAATIAIVLAVALYVQGAWLKSTRAELASAQQQVAALEVSNAAHARALSAAESEAIRRDQAIVDRDAAHTTINSRRADQRRAYTEAVRNDADARDWDAVLLPAHVRMLATGADHDDPRGGAHDAP